LRGLSVLLVVAFHAGFAPLPGGFIGVDVFFVISGFLITGLLVDELRVAGTVSLAAFYARRVRRLLPMACLVLVATALVFRPVLAPIERPGLGGDLQAAALWAANWHFAAESTNYMSTADQSPVLHYWSLSVEEQFYVAWPLLILATVHLRRRPRRWSAMARRLTVGLAVLGAGSLVASVLTTSSAGPWSYFGLHTRAWELAAGGLVAMARPAAAALPRIAAVTVGWAGIAAMGGSAVLLGRDTPYPGIAAIWPVAGAALVMLGGTRTRDGLGLLLGGPVLTYLGRVSYGWYLWHWPCLILVRRIYGPGGAPQDTDLPAVTVSRWALIAAVAVSFVLAVISHQLVEQPVRRSRALLRSRVRSLAVGAGLLAVATAVPAFALRPSTGIPATDVRDAAGVTRQLGAAATPTPTAATAATAGRTSTLPTWPAPGHRTARMTPQQARLDDTAPPRCFLGFASTTVDPTCRFGDPTSATVVVLFGDSHAAQWYPAMVRAATINHWTLYFWAKSGCGYADAPEWISNFNRVYTECATWREAVLKRIAALHTVDTVVVGRNYAQLSKMTGATEPHLTGRAAAAAWSIGSDRVLRRLHATARSVVLVRDTPRPSFDAPACLSKHPQAADRCYYPRAGHVALDTELFADERAAVSAARAQVVDWSDLVCSTDPCPVVSTAGVIMFRDLHHLTATFSRELGPTVARRLAPIVARRPAPIVATR
jgi:peptidoglycan/LPS O-acetylase OafA/YrhL